jgi:hypothetical protein
VIQILAKLEDGSGSNNLILWESKTGTQLAAFSQKAYSNSYVSLEKSGAVWGRDGSDQDGESKN